MSAHVRRTARTLGLVWLSFRLGALDALQYRVDFFIQVVQSLVNLGTALAAVAVVYAQTDELAGWRQEELVALVGVFMLVKGLLALVIRPSLERFMESVRLGTLDFTLTKPADAQLLVSVRRVDVWRVVDVALGALVIVAAMLALHERVGPVQALAFAAVLACGICIVYGFLLILSTLAFWLVRIENLLVIFGSMYDAGRWPVGIYPPLLRGLLTFVVPVAFALTVPVEALVGRLEPTVLVGSMLLATTFLVGSRLFWRHGLRHYTGASA